MKAPCPAGNHGGCCYHVRTWHGREYPVTYEQCCQCGRTPADEADAQDVPGLADLMQTPTVLDES